jgi:pimeloyl-ACP methyl ester carboxylesterase
LTFATRIAGKTKKQGIIAALEGMKDRPDRSIILGLVDYPIMMIIGKHDNVLPSEQLLEQAKKIRDPHVLYLEDAGHMGFLESPKTCHKAIRKFLRACFNS